MGTEKNVLWHFLGARCCCWFSNQQPCSAWELVLFFFPLHFPLHSGDTSTSVGCVVSWWENYLLEKTNPTKDFSSEAVSWPGSWSSCTKDCVIAREGKDEVQIRDGEGAVAFHIGAGSCWLTVFVYCSVPSQILPRPELTLYFKRTWLPLQKILLSNNILLLKILNWECLET